MKTTCAGLVLGLLACVGVFAGCRGETLDVGSAPEAAAGDASGAPETWTGYIESFQLPSGGGDVTLTLSGPAAGTLVFGSGSPAPPTDASKGWPDGYRNDAAGKPVEGFAFALVDGHRTGERLTFSIAMHEPWKAWCELQTEVHPAETPWGDAYNCVPNTGTRTGAAGACGYGDGDGGIVPMECGKLELCAAHVCRCTAAGCTVDLARSPKKAFDIALAGDRASGTTPFGTIRLARRP